MKNIFLTVAALILINCQNSQKETNKFQVATNENKYLDSLIHSKVEHYMIMNTDTFIRVCDSVFIQIPSDCFVDQNGRTHNGKTKLEVCWANSNFDFFLLGLSSLSDKSILETFGMIYLNATTPEGAQLSIKDNKKIKLHFFGEITDETKIFTGVWNEGNMTWTNPIEKLHLPRIDLLQYEINAWAYGIDSQNCIYYQGIDLRKENAKAQLREKFLTPFQIDSLLDRCQRGLVVSQRLSRLFSYKYTDASTFTIMKFGWYNLDMDSKVNSSQAVELNAIVVPSIKSQRFTQASAFFVERRISIPCAVDKSGRVFLRNTENGKFKLPANEPFELFVIEFDDEEIFAAKKLIDNSKYNEILLVKVEINELKDFFDSKK